MQQNRCLCGNLKSVVKKQCSQCTLLLALDERPMRERDIKYMYIDGERVMSVARRIEDLPLPAIEQLKHTYPHNKPWECLWCRTAGSWCPHVRTMEHERRSESSQAH